MAPEIPHLLQNAASPAEAPRGRTKMRRWVIARKLTQAVALMGFLGVFLWARRSPDGLGAFQTLLRLDPLTGLAHFLANRGTGPLAVYLLPLLVVGLTLVFGRAWCGWLCPLGTLLDLLTPPARRWKQGEQKAPPEAWRSIKYGLLLLIVGMAILGNLTLLGLDPLTLFYRSLATSLWPGLDQLITPVELALVNLPWLANPVSTLDSWLRPALLPYQPEYHRSAVLFGVVFAGLVVLNWLAPRFWCRYLCPLGGLLGLLSKLAIFRRRVGQECKACTMCTRACPTGTIRPAAGYASDPGECTVCMECVEACPRQGIHFTPGLSPVARQEYDPNRRQALVALGAGALAVAWMSSEAVVRRPANAAIRPPGADPRTFTNQCIRCGACLGVCPTTALQPALFESGLEGMWTPLIVPRLGYCDYSCAACGAVCPVQAIPRLGLEEKRQQVIGLAFIDTRRCIAWGYHEECIVCEEMCPLPEKAVWLEVSEVLAADGSRRTLQLPHVDRQRCIGCGICEYKCPVPGEAAIHVDSPAQGTI